MIKKMFSGAKDFLGSLRRPKSKPEAGAHLRVTRMDRRWVGEFEKMPFAKQKDSVAIRIAREWSGREGESPLQVYETRKAHFFAAFEEAAKEGEKTVLKKAEQLQKAYYSLDALLRGERGLNEIYATTARIMGAGDKSKFIQDLRTFNAQIEVELGKMANFSGTRHVLSDALAGTRGDGSNNQNLIRLVGRAEKELTLYLGRYRHGVIKRQRAQ